MNYKYNGLEFIKKNMPQIPELRFCGGTIDEYKIWAAETKEKLKENMHIKSLNCLKKKILVIIQDLNMRLILLKDYICLFMY